MIDLSRKYATCHKAVVPGVPWHFRNGGGFDDLMLVIKSQEERPT